MQLDAIGDLLWVRALARFDEAFPGISIQPCLLYERLRKDIFSESTGNF